MIPNNIRFLLIAFCMICALLQVGILNRDSTSGEQLTKIYEEIEKLEQENERLTYQIASASALATIAVRSHQQGFTAQATSMALSPVLPIAFARGTSL